MGNAMGKTIIVSNRLPVSFARTKTGFDVNPSTGGLATGLGSIFSKNENIWIGWPGTDDMAGEKHQITSVLKNKKMYPVFLSPGEIENYYDVFAGKP